MFLKHIYSGNKEKRLKGDNQGSKRPDQKKAVEIISKRNCKVVMVEMDLEDN